VQTRLVERRRKQAEAMDGFANREDQMDLDLAPTLIARCKTKLLQLKQELLNRTRAARLEFESLDRGSNGGGGDEADQTMMILAENEFLSAQARIRHQLLEIELALARIENGTYGICEETDEAIESERLLALPWTRVSIEGAEMREALRKRFAP
jgi:DnaK suppressor protein